MDVRQHGKGKAGPVLKGYAGTTMDTLAKENNRPKTLPRQMNISGDKRNPPLFSQWHSGLAETKNRTDAAPYRRWLQRRRRLNRGTATAPR